jgi:ribosomal protein S18 acetylase RimI-like enzyme
VALAEAFRNDPVLTFILPGEHGRRRMAGFFAATARRYYLRLGAVEIARDEGRVCGAAMWAPPGQWLPSPSRQLLSAPTFLRVLGSRVTAASTMHTAIVRHHPREPHWYLSVLGVPPARQGGGVGGQLLRSRLERCDAEGSPAYLEASKHANIAYYERFGFDVTHEITIPNGPTLWGMWRNAH